MQTSWNTIVSVLAVFTPILLVILAGVGWLYRHEKERREAVERQLSEHKYKAYITLLDIFFDMIKETKEDKVINQNKIVNRMIDANKNLILYGSDEVVCTYQKWLDIARNGKVGLKQFGEIVISMRRDMGNWNTKITPKDVLQQFILDYDEEMVSRLSEK